MTSWEIRVFGIRYLGCLQKITGVHLCVSSAIAPIRAKFVPALNARLTNATSSKGDRRPDTSKLNLNCGITNLASGMGSLPASSYKLKVSWSIPNISCFFMKAVTSRYELLFSHLIFENYDVSLVVNRATRQAIYLHL